MINANKNYFDYDMQVGSGTLDMLAMERDLIDHRIDIRDSQGSQVTHKEGPHRPWNRYQGQPDHRIDIRDSQGS